MAKKISQLTQATQVKSDDVTVIVQDGETKKLPLNTLVTKQDIENKKVAGLAKLDEIEATYENDTYTPTITVKNKSSVKTGEGDEVDYSANVMDGPAKSAILSGNTLVNLVQKRSSDFTVNLEAGKNAWSNYCDLKQTLVAGKKYFIAVTVSENTMTTGSQTLYLNNGNNKDNQYSVMVMNRKKGYLTSVFTANFNTLKSVFVARESHTTDGILTIKNDMILCEYQEGMENWDIPYFEGMQSVKMPVLTTTGKNLFDESQAPEQLSWGNNVKKANVKENTTYVYSSSPYIGHVSFKFYDNNDNEIGQGISIMSGTSFTTPPNTSYLKTHTDNDSLVQIEEGTQATPYEPYKSNILSTPSDLELRGIGEVQDTLDLMTGELTQRVSGLECIDQNSKLSQSGTSNDTTLVVTTSIKSTSTSGKRGLVSSHELIKYAQLDNWFSSLSIIFRLPKANENFATLTAFKQFLTQNPFYYYRELEKEEISIKTVDLMPSGTHPSTTPYCWKNGHIQLSSSGLLPNLEYSVVTSRAGQINQNATMIVKNDKRIFDLEILLAGGLVNTTYQALTLQNQVETGLSKVSLNSETEPDYLLYHMIMKLIEEKAYKLDDLTEKVSVFYLYEKLSDEQFETIYSALYPFVEDEIVEEPVVEELPEVVEDEVIM